MTTTLALLALLATQYSVDVDRFTRRETHSVRTAFVGGRGAASDGVYIAAFTKPGEPFSGGVLLGTITGSESWQYLRCHGRLLFLVDGAGLVEIKGTEHDGHVSGAGGVIEMISKRVPAEKLLPILDAKRSIEVQICNDERKLPLSFARDLQRLLDAVGYQRPAPAAPAGPAPAPPAPAADAPTLETAPRVLACLQQHAQATREEQVERCGWAFVGGAFVR
jgi:hypothetical protein